MTKNEVLHTILAHTEALVYVIDVNNYEVLYANQKCKSEFGDVIGKTCYSVLQADQIEPCIFCPLNQVETKNLLYSGMTFQWENFNSKNKKYYIYHDHILFWGKSQKLAKIQVGLDITKQKQLEESLRKEQEETFITLKSLINKTIEAMLLFDENLVCIFANKPAQVLFGYSNHELLTKQFKDFFILEDTLYNYTFDMDSSHEVKMNRKGDISFPALVKHHNVSLHAKKLHVLAVLDMSVIKQKEEEILHIALHDSLTSLPNRLFFTKTAQTYLQHLNQSSSYFALLFLDLDHFKTINDTKGHSVGDMILIEIANRLKNTLRSTDVFARIGGDEFAILIDTREKDKDKASKNVFTLSNHILQAVKEPIHFDDATFLLTMSIGAVLFNDILYSFEELMKYADTAMYQAKENGRNQIIFFDSYIQIRLEEKAEILSRLRKALCNGDLKLFYQPQILEEFSQKKTVGVEALIRWIDPLKGIILPSEFIELAEENGCIIQLGTWILKEAFSQIKKWENDPLKSSWRISINISARQLERDDFVQSIKILINQIQCNPHKVRFEFTENILIKNTRSNIQKMRELKKLGISLSIDDVGMGYSSLASLKKLPIHELKIDRAFVQGILSNPIDTIIVQMIIDIAKYFKIDLIAEGVETIEQYKKLKQMGCKHFQGFLFSKPIPSEQLSCSYLTIFKE